jgi:hypothetical protein
LGAAAESGRALNAKFVEEYHSDQMAFGGQESFFKGLDGIIGPPNPNLQEGMRSEHGGTLKRPRLPQPPHPTPGGCPPAYAPALHAPPAPPLCPANGHNGLMIHLDRPNIGTANARTRQIRLCRATTKSQPPPTWSS